MKYTINPDIYYGRYGEYTYVRNVRDRMDYLYNEICYDVLEALSVKGGRTPEQLAEYLYTVCEADSMDQGDFMDTLRSDMEEFLEELAGERGGRRKRSGKGDGRGEGTGSGYLRFTDLCTDNG